MAKIFDNFEKIIKAKYSNDSGVTILKCNQSAHLHTVLNIDVCGRLIADEIDEAIAKENVSSLSVIGYSIGGLIARYAAGILFARQLEGRGKHVELGVRILRIFKACLIAPDTFTKGFHYVRLPQLRPMDNATQVQILPPSGHKASLGDGKTANATGRLCKRPPTPPRPGRPTAHLYGIFAEVQALHSLRQCR